MKIPPLRHRPARFLVVLYGGLSLIVAFGAAVFPSSARGAAVSGQAAAVAGPAGSDGTWGKAEEVPGIAALNQDGNAQVTSVSCASAGNCSAGGTYLEISGFQQGFVVTETNGTWHTAREVPGIAALNRGGDATVTSVSCASAGNCAAGGTYALDNSGHQQAFVVNKTNGTWHTAREVPGTAALDQGRHAQVTSVSCGAVGNCSAGGEYVDSSGHGQVFVVSEVNGRWGAAKEVPGSGTLNKGGYAQVTSVSCGAAGNCSAGGNYADNSGHYQVFVVSEVNGRWSAAKEVPGSAILHKSGGYAQVTSVSCASVGNCSAGGEYVDNSGHQQAFVVSKTNGTWHTAREVPGAAALNQGGSAQVSSVSCGSAGNCSAGGEYADNSGNTQVFVVSERDGTWGKAAEVRGTAALNKAGDAAVSSVSCASAGNCSAGGEYVTKCHHFTGECDTQAFVVTETNGKWGTALEVPGSQTLNVSKEAGVNSVSCASAGNCSAGGSYYGPSRIQAFVVNRT
jgi:hypothetical protein